MKKIYLLLIFFIAFKSLNAQSLKKDLFSISTKESTLENLSFLESATIDPNTFFNIYKNSFNLSDKDSMTIYKINKFEGGHTVYRYNQFYKGVKVWGSEYLLHQNKTGKIYLGNGHLGSKIELQVNPHFDINTSIALAIKNNTCLTKPWETKDLKRLPKSELVIYNPSFGSKKITNNYYLAYKVDVYCDKSESIFIDATTGKVLDRIPLQYSCTNATVNTIYNGNQTFQTKLESSDYKLIDDCQTATLTVNDMDGSMDASSAQVIKSVNNTWTSKIQIQGASSLWALKKTYDYYKNKRNFLSIDNLNGPINCYINGSMTDNAFMEPSSYLMYVGQPDTLENSFSTLDIIGHEFTHGVTYYTANLIYNNESGALNESFSDIFGETIEKDITNSIDWLMGNQRHSGAIRSFIDPKQYGCPKYYQGDLWIDGNDVHINSGVQNHWFYLLSQGGGSVTGIGIEKSSAIAFNTLQQYLTSSSNYFDARNQSIHAAIDLYGINSNEVCQVTNAWFEVGVGDACNLNSCDSCHCAVLVKSNYVCSKNYSTLYENSFDSSVAMPNCNGTASSKTKDMWYRFIAEDTSHTIRVELINSGSTQKINPSLSLYKGCNPDSLIKCMYSYKQNDTSLELEANGLIKGQSYLIRFMDFHHSGDTVPKNSTFSLCVTHGKGCPKPKNLKVDKNLQNNSYTISWDGFPNYNYYFNLEYKTLSGFWQSTFVTNPEELSLDFRLICDSTYLWRIQAECDFLSSEWSNIDTFIVDTCIYNNKLTDIVSVYNYYYLSNGLINIYQSLKLTGNPPNTTPLTLKYYLSKNSNGSTMDYVIDTQDISDIFIYRNYYVNRNIDICDLNIPVGDYFLCYIIDEENNLIEDNELNNTGVFGDFFTLDCSFFNADLSTGYPSINYDQNNLIYSNSINNIGSKKSSNFNAYLFLVDSSTNKIVQNIFSKRYNALEPGDYEHIYESIDLCNYNIEPKSYKILFSIDTANESNDVDLTNNFVLTDESYEVTCSVDLEENYSHFSYQNGKATYDISVLNSGTTNSPPFKVGFYLSKSANLSTLDYKLGEVTINTLQNNNSYDISKIYDVCKTVSNGKFYMGYIIDFENQVFETNESNNKYKDSKSTDIGCNRVGIQSQSENEISLYPNPTNGEVYISNLNQKVLVEVFDIHGKLLKSVLTKESVSLEDLSAGTYIIKLEEKVFKVTKNK